MTTSAYQQLAKEFMDLWQKQISSVISDKQFIGAMLDMLQSVQPQANANTRNKSTTSHAAHAPDANGDVLAELAFRLAMCEKRLAALEHAQKPGAKPAAKRKAGTGNKRGSKKPR
jgi:hypothetical protein